MMKIGGDILCPLLRLSSYVIEVELCNVNVLFGAIPHDILPQTVCDYVRCCYTSSCKEFVMGSKACNKSWEIRRWSINHHFLYDVKWGACLMSEFHHEVQEHSENRLGLENPPKSLRLTQMGRDCQQVTTAVVWLLLCIIKFATKTWMPDYQDCLSDKLQMERKMWVVSSTLSSYLIVNTINKSKRWKYSHVTS